MTPGARVGPYEIIAPLGAGGMGEVYRAKDTRLDRTVAIKVLPPSLANDPVFQARFAREAKTISGLDHPHICAMFDVGEADGTGYLVLQYLEGETLAARLTRGALPLDQALKYACEIAAALDHAHRHGIVHRDLKPGNVMLTATGARLLDFGLAKPMPAVTAAQTTRLDSPVTSAGTVVGTIQYMAPEQIEGREADARSDLFAFGAMLHEMLTGQRAFTAPTQAGLMSAILRDTPPPPSSVTPGISRVLDHVVQRCLAKDPEERWASAHDLLLQLTWIRQSGTAAGASIAPSTTRSRWRTHAAWILVALAACAITGGIALRLVRPGPAPASPPSRFTLAPPPGLVWLSYNAPSVSPDGRWVVAAASTSVVSGEKSVLIRRIDDVGFRPVQSIEDSFNPNLPWSADSRSFFYAQGQQLKRVAVDGGSPEVVCAIPSGGFEGATSNADGVMLLGFGDRPLHRVSPGGAVAEPVLSLDSARGEVGQIRPAFLPDGVHYVFVSISASRWRVMVARLGSTERTELIANASSVMYVPPGLLIFQSERGWLVQLFDPVRLALEGQARAIEPQFAPNEVSVSSTGALVYNGRAAGPLRVRGEVYAGNTRLAWFDRAGHELDTIAPLAAYDAPRLSPDDRFVAVERFDSQNPGDVWIVDAQRRLSTRLTSDPGRDSDPTWSPDGQRVASIRNGDTPQQQVVVQRVDRSDAPEVVPMDETASNGRPGPFVGLGDWSPDGRYLTVNRWGDRAGIEVLSVGGSTPVAWPRAASGDEGGSQFSPDGRWLAYQSDETGTWEVYVQAFPPRPGKIRVSTSGGRQPVWRRDGGELFYLASDRTLTAVPVRESASGIDVGAPVALFKAPVPNPGWSRNGYQVSKDGKRFLLVVLDKTQPTAAPDVILVLGWAQAMYNELRK